MDVPEQASEVGEDILGIGIRGIAHHQHAEGIDQVEAVRHRGRFVLHGAEQAGARLRERLGGVRLFRMLERRAITVDAYLKAVEPAAVAQQIARCETCAAVVQCDAALAEAPADGDYTFCPNAGGIAELASRQARETRAARSPRGAATTEAAGRH